MNPSSSSSASSSSSLVMRKKDSTSDDETEQSNCKRLKNDVFINYSFEDIGNGFISHLKRSLTHRCFLISDHKDPQVGQDVCSEVLKTIEESEIYVVVFSNNYACSVRSLDELVDIMECLDKFDQRKVLPVFYKVEPSDVRNQEGSFKEAFQTHEANEDIDLERVQKWKQALKDAGQLSGLTMQNGDEGKFVSEIVKQLERMQSPQELHVADHPVVIGSRVKKLISTLRLDCEDVLVVAVFGISGIGKTTIVKATYNKISSNFNVSCFLGDIHYHGGGLNGKIELQNQLISRLTQNDKFPSMHHHNDGITKIKKLVRGRKILLVLDDVDNFEQLKSLGINPAWFYKGSRIIVITRDKQSLGNIPYTSYEEGNSQELHVADHPVLIGSQLPHDQNHGAASTVPIQSYHDQNLKKFRIPLEEIRLAIGVKSTESQIGDGGFGLVYKGKLSELWQNRTAAIKYHDPKGYQGQDEFRNEIQMISMFHHENIIPFIGYCDEGNEMIIVSEYATNGSLDHYLRDLKKRRSLTWVQRLKICLGGAKGLNYLHSGLGDDNRVVHRDVKSANILLDDNLTAKICDFGLSRSGPRNQPQTQLYTQAAGTKFYIDPIYNESGILRKESDVYSFGVVLFEALSGMLAYYRRRIGDDKPQPLINLVRRYYEEGPDKLIDHLIKDQIDSHSFKTFVEIAHECISYNLNERPTMQTLIERIEDALAYQVAKDSEVKEPEAKITEN